MIKITFMGLGINGTRCLKKLLTLKKYCHIVNIILPKGFAIEDLEKIAASNKIKYKIINGLNSRLVTNLKKYKPDLVVVASFPWKITPPLLRLPRLGILNVHASLLPKYRGRHPLNWCVIHDEPYTGVSIHYMDEGFDTGPVITQKSIPITDKDNINTLVAKTSNVGATLLKKVVKRIAKCSQIIRATPQDDEFASFAPRRFPKDSQIYWTQRVRRIFNLVRASTNPYPNAFSYRTDGTKLYFNSSIIPKLPGQVIGKVNAHYIITAADGVILLKTDTQLKIGEILK